MAERVKAVLLELLPSGEATTEAVAKRLGASPRTLQRRLREEGRSFQCILSGTRKALARHYLKTTSLSAPEIAFLLGFDDPRSFFRAHSSWTGATPEQPRQALRTSL